ncbi:MAG TPA: SDR family NAD(P)-dependent oxidoreductase [Candidatus Acidoferrales bacterium]|nr:SDR family NAD(P)-dependent oxidoreductase [Candidatus Acidoferrales bacterium]
MTALQSKTVLVTGASRGIGRATAEALVEAGADVLVHYGRARFGRAFNPRLRGNEGSA